MQGPLILDRYRPLDTAGEGGSGIVQICWDASLQRRVAIKRMPITQQGAEVPGLAEARTGAMLKNPNIVSVIDFAVQGGEAYLIMEAIEGVSLRKLIKETPRGEIDLDVISTVAHAIAEALDFAHENQVLHLDIKPENVLVDKSGLVKISDFGISELADAQGFGSAGGGTIGYMPPEQICGEDLDQRCDEFAFAAVIYELLCGTNPFAARTLDRSLELMEAGDYPLPSEVRRDVDPAVDDVLLRALSPDRRERYETIYDFAVALLPLLGNHRRGREILAELSRDDEEERRPADTYVRANGLWDRVPEKVRLVAGRAAAAVLSWWIASVGLVGMGLMDAKLALGLSLIPAVVAAILPSAGALIAVVICGIAMVVNPALPALLGIGLIVVAAGWWLAAGHGSVAAPNTMMLIAPAGLIGITPLAPMLTGFTCTVGRALITAVMQSLLALCLAICTGSASILRFKAAFLSGPDAHASMELAAQPETWGAIIGFILCAVLVSALCSRQTRVSSIIGTLLGTAVLVIAQIAAVRVATGSWGMFGIGWVIAILVSCIVTIVVGVLGAPYRAEKEG